jgi:hypothetical protein
MVAYDPLTAPEALVLMSLPRFSAQKALKVGMLELLARGVLSIEMRERHGFFRTKRDVHIHLVSGAPMPPSRIATTLLRMVRFAEPSEGVITDIVAQSIREYGRGFSRFVTQYVVPCLAARGLAESRRKRILLVPVTRFYRTPAGEAEAARLEAAMREARAIPDWLDRDPAQAVALAAAAGSAILMMDELRPHFQQLGKAMRPPGADGGDGGGGDTGTGDTSASDLSVLSWGVSGSDAFDFGGWVFDAFDSIDGAFDAFDAGFDSASGGDGGDGGGGGDGGSSGC